MATINVFNEEDGKTYTVTVNLVAGILDRINGLPTDLNIDFYLQLSTTIKKVDNSSFPIFIIRNLSDTPTGFGVAASWSELINNYVDYFLTQSTYGMSSSSSTSSSSTSSSSNSSLSSNSSSSSTSS